MYKHAIDLLLQGQSLPEESAAAVMTQMMEGQLSDAQTAAFLTLLAVKGETVDELTGLARAMRNHAEPVELEGTVVDTCGTGGSGLDTPNTSTMVAFILAAAGLRVAKHGNRASTGRCGSMDLLEALEVPIVLGPKQVVKLVESCNIGFMFAPRYHPAMKHVVPVRKTLGFRTVFNFLGPLANPASVGRQVLGVSDAKKAPLMAEALGRLGVERALVVHGEDGLDEITLTTRTQTYEVAKGQIKASAVHPEEVGLSLKEAAEIQGGDREKNVRLFLEVLREKKRGPVRDLALVNAAAGLYVGGAAASIKEGVALANDIIESGAAYKSFENYRREAQALAVE